MWLTFPDRLRIVLRILWKKISKLVLNWLHGLRITYKTLTLKIRQNEFITRLQFQVVEGEIKMETIVMLTNELPLLMAPASLISALLVASLISAVIRFQKKPFKVMAIGVMLALSAGMLMMKSMT